MIILLLHQQPLTTKQIERSIQYSRILDYLETARQEILEGVTLEEWLVKKGISSSDAILKGAILFYTIDFKNFKAYAKNELSAPNHYLSAEEIRLKLVSSLNNYLADKIPSSKKIEAELRILDSQGDNRQTPYYFIEWNGNIRMRTSSKGVWTVSNAYYKLWFERRAELLKESRYDGTDFIARKYTSSILDYYLLNISTRKEHASVYLSHLPRVKELVNF